MCSLLRVIYIKGEKAMPVFFILVILAACALCLLLSVLYRPLGGVAKQVWKEAKDAVSEEDKNKGVEIK